MKAPRLNIAQEPAAVPAQGAEEHRCSSCGRSHESPRGIVTTEHGRPAWKANPCFTCENWIPQDSPKGDAPFGPELAQDPAPIEAFTIDQIVQICKVTRSKVYWWVRAKQLPAIKVRGDWYVKGEDLVAFRNAGKDKLDRRGRPRKEKAVPDGDTLNAAEAAILIGISRTSIGNLLEQGKIPYRQTPTGRYQLDRADVLAFAQTYVRRTLRRAQPAKAPTKRRIKVRRRKAG